MNIHEMNTKQIGDAVRYICEGSGVKVMDAYYTDGTTRFVGVCVDWQVKPKYNYIQRLNRYFMGNWDMDGNELVPYEKLYEDGTRGAIVIVYDYEYIDTHKHEEAALREDNNVIVICKDGVWCYE